MQITDGSDFRLGKTLEEQRAGSDDPQLRTEQRQRELFLQEHQQTLENQLEASERRYRELFLQEQRRARHLSLINEVQKCALASREIESFLPQVTRAIGSHFSDCDVTFYLACGPVGNNETTPSDVLLGSDAGELIFDLNDTALHPRMGADDDETGSCGPGEMIVVATAGSNELSPVVGSHRTFEPSQVARVELSAAPSLPEEVRSHLSVPIPGDEQTVGLLVVQSRESDALDARDVTALGTAAAIIGSHLNSSRLFRHMREVNAFNQNLLNSMLHSLLVLDARARLHFVNERALQTFAHTREELRHQPLTALLGEGPTRHHQLCEIVEQVLNTGESREVPEVHVWTGEGMQVFDVRLFRVFFRGRAQAIMLLINLTQRWRKTSQLQMMNEISALFGTSLDARRVLSTVLTCVTAGSALGFNRAFVFLLDESGETLEGRMALGPSSAEEAARIWNEISQRELSLSELLERIDDEHAEPTPLQARTRQMRLRLDNPCLPILHDLMSGHARRAAHSAFFHLACDDAEAHQAALEAAQLLSAHEFAVAPLATKDRLLGVVFADNLYSGAPVEADDVQMLDTLAGQATLAIDNALTYGALQDAQRELVSAERLVAVGEMSARVSHEIRNPLATIGGFARSIAKKPDELESVKRKTQVIVEEVARLEELLTDLLDMARPRPLQLRPHDLNEIVEHALLLAESDVRTARAEIEKQLSDELPPLVCDRSRLLQALLNTLRNGAQAMPDGGILHVETRLSPPRGDAAPDAVQIKISDSGVGISQHALKQVFDPFFSTKISGSGLGLAVTKRILQDHNGHIDVESASGEGTTFIFTLPLTSAPENADEDANEDATGNTDKNVNENRNENSV